LGEPFLLMIAGPNGAGKTTLTQHLVRKGIDLGEYINPDDIAAGLTGSVEERTKLAQSMADKRREECIRAKKSFTFETVMSHPSKIEVLVRAKEAGYAVFLYFVGTDDPKTNIERVALRVAQGGHAVPDDKVRDRWLRTMLLLQQAVRASDRAYIFDNSAAGTVDSVPRLVFYRNATRSGRLPQYETFGTPPAWVTRFALDPIGVNFFDKYGKGRFGTVGSIVTLPLEAGGLGRTRTETIASLTEPHRQLPHNIEAEQRLLGAVLAEPESFNRVSGFLEARHMFEPIHQTIFEIASKTIREEKLATSKSLRMLLPIDVNLGPLTLGQYLDHLEAEKSAPASVYVDGRTIYELSLRRELIRLAEGIAEAAHDDGPSSTSRAQVERAVLQLRQLVEAYTPKEEEPLLPLPSLTMRGLHEFSGALTSAVDSAARAFPRIGSGIKTGFADIDRKIVGLQPSELIVLASRPGIGKTALATNIAYNVSRAWRREESRGSLPVQGGIVGFFSLEMSSEQIATRVISQQSRIPVSSIRRGAISEREFEIIRDKAIEFQNLPFFIDETTTLSIGQLVARAHRLKSERGLDLLIIDNLQLLRTDSHANFGTSRKSSLEITRQLKNLAKDLGIPVLALSQLPSKFERRDDPRPRLDEFSDRGAIEQDADLILFLHRDDFYLLKEEPSFGGYEHENWMRRVEIAHGLAELIITKHRNGATGTVTLSFDLSIGSFADLALQSTAW
jgi:replicative DNA helicase